MEFEGASSSASKGMIAVTGVFLSLSWIAVLLRVYVRGFMIRYFWWDDGFTLVALAFFTAHSSILITISWIELTEGLHQLEWVSRLMDLVVQDMAFYISSSIFLKLSLAAFFLRIVIEPWQRRTIYISTALYTLYTSGYLFVVIFQCGNPSLFLVHRIEGKCISWSIIGPLNYAHGSLNAATDWMFATIPFFMLWKTQIPRQAKISVYCISALGVFGSIASLIRLAYIQGLDSSSFRFFETAVSIADLSIIEPGLGITAASLATLRPLLRSILERSNDDHSTNSSTNDGIIRGRRSDYVQAKRSHDIGSFSTD